MKHGLYPLPLISIYPPVRVYLAGGGGDDDDEGDGGGEGVICHVCIMLDLEVLTSFSNIAVVEDQWLIFQQLMNFLLDKDEELYAACAFKTLLQSFLVHDWQIP
ncbi:hypothetical protein Tco_0971144 [Tanacetum coccineum]